jgi:hypothetical protein
VARDLTGLDFTLKEASALSANERKAMLALFRASYRQANPEFLEKSIRTFRFAAFAERAGTPVGFALGETRMMDLPRLPAQVVSLAGLCCIDESFRRRGLFGDLERRVLTAGAVPRAPRRLFCGRMAHPAALRVMVSHATRVPKPGQAPTPWQREVGQTVAEAYGVHGFDPETFVCIGSGRPIGYPNMVLGVDSHEWEIFEPVDRDRGDALLAIAWLPDAPAGW